MLIQFVQMGKKLFHHPALERRHHAVQVIDDLLLCGFEVMGNDFLFIHLIVFCLVKGFPGKEIFQDTAGTFAIDI